MFGIVTKGVVWTNYGCPTKTLRFLVIWNFVQVEFLLKNMPASTAGMFYIVWARQLQYAEFFFLESFLGPHGIKGGN